MADICNCNEGQEEHEHCLDCDGILKCNESENYCRWCEERIAKEAKEANYIDVTPSWADITPALLLVLEQPNGSDKSGARDELLRMARIADCWVNHCREVSK